MGDFNEVLSNDEIEGDSSRPNWQTRNFRNVVNGCGFVDLGWQGYKYIWVNNHDNPSSYVEEQLDRCFAKQNWLHLFSMAQVHVFQQGSDHVSLVIHLKGKSHSSNGLCNQKKFEAWWVKYDSVTL